VDDTGYEPLDADYVAALGDELRPEDFSTGRVLVKSEPAPMNEERVF